MRASTHIVEAADRACTTERPKIEQIEALVEMAFDLQKQPRDVQELVDAIYLYDRAIVHGGELVAPRARALAGKGAALRRFPGTGPEELELARDALSEALQVLEGSGGQGELTAMRLGEPEEIAEIRMTLGLCLQALAAHGRAPLKKAVEHYHAALRTFSKEDHPREFAILHNNLATAYLAMKLSPEREVMREALAVQSFKEALQVVTLVEDPTEYAMLQNNLGNALQAMRKGHPLENLIRAVEAYDEALKVRTERDMPLEFANTTANKANALMNLPDDPEHPAKGNPSNLRAAIDLLAQSKNTFEAHGVLDRAGMVSKLQAELESELAVNA